VINIKLVITAKAALAYTYSKPYEGSEKLRSTALAALSVGAVVDAGAYSESVTSGRFNRVGRLLKRFTGDNSIDICQVAIVVNAVHRHV
jgi:hypothetical protein